MSKARGDNISKDALKEVPKDVPKEVEEKEQPKKATEVQQETLYTPKQACEELKKILRAPTSHFAVKAGYQVVDGGVVEFWDAASAEKVAEGRLRFKNNLLVTEEGEMYTNVKISELSVKKASMLINAE